MHSLVRYFGLIACGFIACVSVPGVCSAEAPQTGTFRGTIRFLGEVPVLPPLVKQGDPGVKDAAVCAASTIPDESLVVSAKSRGIANVFVYLRKRPENYLADDSQQEKKKPVVLEQKGCRYVPHVMIVRTNQAVKVVGRDKIAHNAHFYPFKNTNPSSLVPPNGEALIVEFDRPEILPIKVGCDIHPWMEAWVLIVDHPFAAVTDKNGKFRIEALPPGEYEFWIWQENSGWLEKRYKVKIEAGETTEATLSYAADRFEE